MAPAPSSRVRLYLGTEKGTYVATTDLQRSKWKVTGPFQPGSAVFHVVPDPRTPGDVYALANSGFWGPGIFRSRDYGVKWSEVATPGFPPPGQRKAPKEFGKFPPEAIRALWHLEPGRADEPKTLFLGADPHRLYRSDDSGASWEENQGIAQHPTRPKWAPGGGGPCLHTILLDPERPSRMYVGLSAAGTFRTDDSGKTWKPMNRGVAVNFLPETRPEVGQCVHHVALDPSDSTVAYRQDHNGIYLSEDSMEHWTRVGKPLSTDFGFVVATSPSLPGGAIFAPLSPPEVTRTMPGQRFQLYWFDRKKRNFRPMVRSSPFLGEFGNHREGLAIDRLDPAGIYYGSTGGQVIYTPDAGRSWSAVPFQFPKIHSVSVSAPAGL